MESLLSLAFDNLSSYDGVKIRKGLRQIEGLLAQLCLTRSSSTAAERRRSVAVPSVSSGGEAKEIQDLKTDAAFREFFKLQEGFEWNVTLRLVTCLDRLLGRGSNGQNDLLILSTLDLIQGVLLLHPPSQTLFAREIYMNLLLDLLDPSNCPAIQSCTLLTLVCALISQPANTRVFENLDGLLIITSLFKQRSTSREVKLKLIEFLYFYLMPENNLQNGSGPNTPQAASKQRSALSRRGSVYKAGERVPLKTIDDKQALLGRYLNNVEGLVEDLRESAPFGSTVC